MFWLLSLLDGVLFELHPIVQKSQSTSPFAPLFIFLRLSSFFLHSIVSLILQLSLLSPWVHFLLVSIFQFRSKLFYFRSHTDKYAWIFTCNLRRIASNFLGFLPPLSSPLKFPEVEPFTFSDCMDDIVLRDDVDDFLLSNYLIKSTHVHTYNFFFFYLQEGRDRLVLNLYLRVPLKFDHLLALRELGICTLCKLLYDTWLKKKVIRPNIPLINFAITWSIIVDNINTKFNLVFVIQISRFAFLAFIG